MPQNGHGWWDGPTDPCAGGKRVFQASDRRTDGQTFARMDGQPKIIMPPVPKCGGITNYNTLVVTYINSHYLSISLSIYIFT